MKWTKKKTIVTVVIVAVAAGVVYKVNQSKAAVAQMANMVSTTQVLKQDIEETLGLKAVLEGTESVEVQSNLHAEVLTIHVKEGDKVEKGQLLATLDRSTIEKELSLAQNNINLQQLQLEESLEGQQIKYDEAVTALDKAQKDYDQAKALYETGASSKQEVTDAEAALDAAQKTVDTFTVSNGKVVASAAENKAIANAQASLASSREQLDDCEIRSQIDGTVTRVYTKVGRFADDTENKQPMFVIENIDSLQMKVLVSEYDISKIQVGQTAEITADILGEDVVKGVVERISPTGELKEGSSAERVIPVYIKITESNPKLIAGITAKANILLNRAENTLVLPYEAILEQPESGNVVYKVNEDNTVTIVPVTLGIENDLMAEVQGEGLQEGDKVIMNPSPTLTEGMTVNPMM